MNESSITIIFDPATWTPTTVLINAENEEQEARLREIADRMLTNIERPEDET